MAQPAFPAGPEEEVARREDVFGLATPRLRGTPEAGRRDEVPIAMTIQSAEPAGFRLEQGRPDDTHQPFLREALQWIARSPVGWVS